MNVSDKTVVVTGGGNGIGRELVLHLLSKGARVAAVDMSEAALAETTKLAGEMVARLSCHQLNVTDRAAVEALPAQVIAAHGAVDGLINNAGIIQPFVNIADLDYPTIERVMNVNFYGTVYMTKAFLPLLLSRPEAHVVNISSMGGFLPVPGQSVYGASKAAVKLLTEGLRSELLETNVKVTIVFPGAIATDIAAHSGAEMKSGATKESSAMKLTTPVRAAQIIVEGMEKNRFRILVGNDAKFLDFLYRLHPRFAAEFIYKQMKALM
jgi:short-subunit dehydrogenase